MKKITIIAALAISAIAAAPVSALSFDYPQASGNLLMLGATERAILTTVDDDNVTFREDNGLNWWNYNGKSFELEDGSMGFSAIGANLSQGSCDTNRSNDDVLCWHNAYDLATDTVFLTQGYRWDQATSVDDESGTYRIVFTSDNPEYYPSGVRYDVPVQDLAGWTACWADDWGSEWGDQDVSYADLFAACDGDYLMLAVADTVTEGVADDLAETGFNPAPVAAAAVVALIGGVIAVRRRRHA